MPGQYLIRDYNCAGCRAPLATASPTEPPAATRFGDDYLCSECAGFVRGFLAVRLEPESEPPVPEPLVQRIVRAIVSEPTTGACPACRRDLPFHKLGCAVAQGYLTFAEARVRACWAGLDPQTQQEAIFVLYRLVTNGMKAEPDLSPQVAQALELLISIADESQNKNHHVRKGEPQGD